MRILPRLGKKDYHSVRKTECLRSRGKAATRLGVEYEEVRVALPYRSPRRTGRDAEVDVIQDVIRRDVPPVFRCASRSSRCRGIDEAGKTGKCQKLAMIDKESLIWNCPRKLAAGTGSVCFGRTPCARAPFVLPKTASHGRMGRMKVRPPPRLHASRARTDTTLLSRGGHDFTTSAFCSDSRLSYCLLKSDWNHPCFRHCRQVGVQT